MSAIDTLIGYTDAPTQQLVAADGVIEYAYRDSWRPTLHSVSAIHCMRLCRNSP